MTSHRTSSMILVAAGCLLAGAAAEAPPSATMAAPTQQRLQIRTVPLAAATYAPSVAGYARVIDTVPLATLDADLSVAIAAAAASQAEAARAQILNAEDQMVATKAAEAAVAVARADQARLRLLRTRLGLEWGRGVAKLSDGQRAALIRALAGGNAALLRIDASTPSTGGGYVPIDMGPLGVARARILGPARSADARLQSAGRLALVSGSQAQALSVGLVVPVQLSAGASQTGVIAPDAAVLRAEGSSWVFVKTGADSYERRELIQPAPVDGGLFVSSGLSAGQIVVTSGASALYAAERAGG